MSIQETNLTAIANAIRSKTGETGKIKASNFASKINSINVGLTRWVTNDTSIQVTGTYANSTYYDTTYGVKIGYMPDGKILLSMKGGTSTGYEKLKFELGGNIGGISVTLEAANATGSYTGGEPGLIYACVLSGINRKVKINVNMNSVNSSYDYTVCSIVLTQST